MSVTIGLYEIVFLLIGLLVGIFVMGFAVFFWLKILPVLKTYIKLGADERRTYNQIIERSKKGQHIFYLTYEDLTKLAEKFGLSKDEAEEAISALETEE